MTPLMRSILEQASVAPCGVPEYRIFGPRQSLSACLRNGLLQTGMQTVVVEWFRAYGVEPKQEKSKPVFFYRLTPLGWSMLRAAAP